MPPALQTIAISIVLLAGCQKSETPRSGDVLEATATAERDEKGNVRLRDPTPGELTNHRETILKIDAVDRQFPRPEVPVGVSRSKAIRVLAPADIELSDGRTVRLDGVSCSATGLDYLSRLLIDPDTSLLVVPTGQAIDHAIPSDIWAASKLRDGLMTYSSPTETALTSGWCDVQPTETCKHNDRYAALVDAFREEREKAMGNAR